MSSLFDHILRAILLGRFAGERIVALYSAHFDGSGKPETHEVVTVSGCVAEMDQWISFEGLWRRVMIDNGLPPETIFHMTDFAACKRPFDIYKADSNDAEDKRIKSKLKAKLLAELIDCMRCCLIKAFSIGVIVRDFTDCNIDYKLRESVGHEYTFCGLMCIWFTLQWARDNTISDHLQFIFEKGEEYQNELDDKAKAWFGIIVESLDKTHVQFQPGDLIAWKSRKALTDAITDGPSGDLRLLDSIQRSTSEINSLTNFYGVYGRAELTDLCRHSKTWEIPKRLIIAV